ncbi:MAG: hypothetical protein IT383_28265 [Deltaproteobacteria bacterium]|nr:hypothetical protein [Deltaproteobacteria bacterium]
MPRCTRTGVRSMVGALALAALASTGAGCGRAHVFYDARELRHPPLQPSRDRALDQELAGKLGGRPVLWVDAEGKERTLAGDAQSLRALGTAERGALWLALQGGERGGESDVRVRVTGKGSIPVTVEQGLDGALRVVSARRGGRDDDGDALSEEAFRERFKLRGRLPGNWHENERRALTEALALLAPGELELVRRIVWDREGRARNGDESRAALYEMKGCRAVIYLYSSGVRADRFRFVGEPSAPKSAVTHAIVHEIGHAFEQAAARRAYCASEKAGARAGALIDEGNRLSERGPVLDEYLRVLAGLPAPTDYGNASSHESFAESFALFHVDPAALLRTRPAVHAWFAAGAHLRALGALDD